jgi:hypothetical protein
MSIGDNVVNMQNKVKCYLYRPYESLSFFLSKKINNNKDIFIIVGSQRSGTTLLGLALGAHPDITVFDEDVSYKLLDSGKFNCETFCGFKCPVYTHRYKIFKRMYPNANYLFVSRNILSIVSSMLNLKMGDGRSWAESQAYNGLVRSLSTLENRKLKNAITGKLKEFKTKRDFIEIATLCAYVKQYYITEYMQNNLRVLEVVYEDFVLNPKKELMRILNFLDVGWHDNVLVHHTKSKGYAIGGTEKNRPIDNRSVDKWKTILRKDEINRISDLVVLLQKETQK